MNSKIGEEGYADAAFEKKLEDIVRHVQHFPDRLEYVT